MRPIPQTLARALADLTVPSGREEFLKVYGRERGEVEWEGSLPCRQEARRRQEIDAILAQARAIAEANGWDWAEVERAAREEYPHLFKEAGEQAKPE